MIDLVTNSDIISLTIRILWERGQVDVETDFICWLGIAAVWTRFLSRLNRWNNKQLFLPLLWQLQAVILSTSALAIIELVKLKMLFLIRVLLYFAVKSWKKFWMFFLPIDIGLTTLQQQRPVWQLSCTDMLYPQKSMHVVPPPITYP